MIKRACPFVSLRASSEQSEGISSASSFGAVRGLLSLVLDRQIQNTVINLSLMALN